MQTSVDPTFQAGLEHHMAGRLPEAERLYRQALALDPAHAESIHNLGLIAHQMGKHQIAVDLIRRAIAIQPNHGAAYNNLGSVLNAIGQTDDAIASFHKSIELSPTLIGAHNNLGNALRSKGQLDEATAAYQAALAINPNYLEAHNNLGNTLFDQGHFDQAIASFRQALACNPDFAEPHYNLGRTLKQIGQLSEAIAALARAIEIKNDFADALFEIANAQRGTGQLDDAIISYRRFLKLQPDSYAAQNDLGNVLRDRGRLPEAIKLFEEITLLFPERLHAHVNLGNSLKDVGRDQAAIKAYRRAIEIDPACYQAHNNLGNVLRDKDNLEAAIACYQTAIRYSPTYPSAYTNLGNAYNNIALHERAYETHKKALQCEPTNERLHSNLVYAMHFSSGFTPSQIAAELARWNQLHALPVLEKHFRAHTNDPIPDRRLRIAYLSPDLCEHVVGQSLLPLLSHHDRRRFDITCYAQVPSPDSVTRKLERFVDRWYSIVGLSDERVAEQVRSDRIDILIDLSLHTGHNRLRIFAFKPAPVQVTHLGYCGSTGMTAVDYRLSDPHMDPAVDLLEIDESLYSEKTIRLRNSFWCYDPRPAPSPAPAPVLKNGFITFGCLNNFAKASQAALQLWARLLATLPTSRMIIHSPAGAHLLNVQAEFERAGVDKSRITFPGKMSFEKYMRTFGEIDIALDPFPYGGGVTSCDGLWMGVPLITLSGQMGIGRGGRSILNNLGLPELVASTPEEFIQIATALSQDHDRLIALRKGMRARMQASPLMDATNYAKDIEAAYIQMWQAWCETVAQPR